MNRDVSLHEWQPRAVVFDWDGTLANTKSAWAMAKRRVFARRNQTLGQAVLAATHGLHPSQSAQILASALDDDATLIEAELTEFSTANLSVSAPEMPGAYAVVTRIAGNLPVMVASNSPRIALMAGLHHSRFAFEEGQTVTADEVEAPKPDPALYREACRRLGHHPADVLAFEDSAVGMRSACEAGLRVIGVNRADIGERLGVDLMVPSMEDPRIEKLLGAWFPLKQRSVSSALDR